MWRSVRGIIALGSVLVALGVAASPATAQLIQAIASGDVNCKASTADESDSFIVTANIVSTACDVIFQDGSFGAQSVVDVRVLFNVTPFVDVQAHSDQTNGAFGAATAFGQANLVYQSDIQGLLPPPFFSSTYPLLLRAPWGMSDFGSPGVTATTRLEIIDSDGVVFFSDLQQLGIGPGTGVYLIGGEAAVDDPFTIIIESFCATVAPADGASDCQAIIDPEITFDQDTFDAMHGLNSYLLSDYFAIVQSDNLVPEPGIGSLLAAGVLGLAGIWRRRMSPGQLRTLETTQNSRP